MFEIKLFLTIIFFFFISRINSLNIELNFEKYFERKQNLIFKDFPELLILENEYLSTFPKTSYLFELSDSDFILCKENPKYPSSKKISSNRIIYKDLEFNDTGKFNNFIIETFLKFKNYNETMKGLEVGYQSDPLFFAFLYNLGRFNFLQKEYAKSIFYFKKILYYFPNYPRAHYYLGKNYYSLRDEILGEYHFRKAIQLEPEQIQYLVDFISILYEKKQFSKAQLYSSYGEKKFGNHPFFLIFKIKQLTKEKKFSEALQIFNKISNQSLDEFQRLELKFAKSQLLEQIQDLENALKEIEEILQSNHTSFFNQYPKENILQQRERIKKIIDAYKY